MTQVMINKEICTGCGLCVKDCSRNAIVLVDDKAKVDLELCNECGHCLAICPFGSVSMPLYDADEIIKFDKEKMSIEPDNLLNFLKFRRSIRQFKDKDIEPETLNKIIEAGRYSPTASNRQMNRFIIIRDKLNEVRDVAIKTLYDMGNDPSCIDKTSWSLYHKAWIKMYEDYKEKNIDRLFFNAPAVIAIVSEEKAGFADVNGGIAASRMELEANSLGLGVCYIGFFKRAITYNKKLRELLGMKENEEFILCFVLGYPNVKYQRTVNRKPADVRYI
ncbi:MAG TPA: nitroreductase family protein [Sedimentibacter sp.]|nr:nitroreductase family protein [Sedimentibacter sp.]